MSKRVLKLAVCAVILLGTTFALQAADASKHAEKAQATNVEKQAVSCNDPSCASAEKFTSFAAGLTKSNRDLFENFTKDQKQFALVAAGYLPGKAADVKLLTPDEAVQKVAATLK